MQENGQKLSVQLESLIGKDQMQNIKNEFKDELKDYLKRLQRGEQKLQDSNINEFFQEFDTNEACQELDSVLDRKIGEDVTKYGV